MMLCSSAAGWASERRAAARDGEQRLPGQRHRGRQVDEEVRVLAMARAVSSGPLEVARRPVQVLGDARSSIRRAGDGRSGAGHALDHPRVLAAAALRRVDHQRALSQRHPGQPPRVT